MRAPLVRPLPASRLDGLQAAVGKPAISRPADLYRPICDSLRRT